MLQEAEEFLTFSNIINEYVSAIMIGLDLNVCNYDHQIVWDYIISSQEAKIRGFDFSGTARWRYSGFIFSDEIETSVVYNTRMSQKRINFTISHELVHLLYHLDAENHTFADTKDVLESTSTDYLVEFQANIGASAILLPEPVMIKELKAGTPIPIISDTYGISEAALFNRLIQTMQSQFLVSYFAASQTAKKIMNRYHNGGKAKMMELGRNLEKKSLDINPFYEALCL
ncbi:Zn-dependent peptidase ImmA (M78 family) [Enterococcus sp. PF1-24]|uniref:ImmA/IrrE family metallo-endopeptidase n=1 Tax=unclassified Enterococcus TaxID=2608891 RepID=UPI0024749224|nr:MULTISPECIES: ImmA/IrrE family metallo-endopeptidase [unclassified Enterococcus]MDH6364657.1 Zn-dependent peptidase ImmA (M78 family) [Enterococcus sp. PFB1-1]MDH6401758.1 Zn-dependent peptidase ImmA (M78 family) [Enterococcus sp. PF1-24]